MLRRCAFPLLPALAVTAIAVTGCGGSSKKSSTSTTGTARTASGSTGTTSGTGTTSSGLSLATPLNSPLAQSLFREEGVTHGLTSAEATKFVACLESKFASQGMKSFGDASSNTSQTRLDSENCALSVKTGG